MEATCLLSQLSLPNQKRNNDRKMWERHRAWCAAANLHRDRAMFGRTCAQVLLTQNPYQVRGTHKPQSTRETPKTVLFRMEVQGEGCSEQPPPPSPSGAPQDTEFPPPLFNQQQSPGVSQLAATQGKSASPCYTNKKGVATNNGASSFSGDPQKLSQRTRPQELLPSYQVGADGGQMGSIPAHPPAATILRPCLLTPLPSPPVWVPVSSLPRRGASSPSS